MPPLPRNMPMATSIVTRNGMIRNATGKPFPRTFHKLLVDLDPPQGGVEREKRQQQRHRNERHRAHNLHETACAIGRRPTRPAS